MQLKYARDIKWNDLARIENPFFARSTVKRELSRPISSLRGGFGSDSNPLALINKQGRQAVDADRLQQFYQDIEQGRVLLIHDFDLSPQHRAFEPVVDKAKPDAEKKQYKLKDNMSNTSATALESVLINTKKPASPGRIVSRTETSTNKIAYIGSAATAAKNAALKKEECLKNDVPGLKEKRLEKYWGTSDEKEIKKKAETMLGLDKANIPPMQERKNNWELFKKNHIPAKMVTEDDHFKVDGYGQPLGEGPQPGTNAYKNLEKYALTSYGSLMIKKVNDGFKKDVNDGLYNGIEGTLTPSGEKKGYQVFRIKINNDKAPESGPNHIILFDDFVPEGRRFQQGGQIVDPIAIIHHEFEHTRFGTSNYEAGDMMDEIAAVKKLENPVRALNGHEPRYTYTEMKGGIPIQTMNIIDTSKRVKGGATYCKNDPSMLVQN